MDEQSQFPMDLDDEESSQLLEEMAPEVGSINELVKLIGTYSTVRSLRELVNFTCSTPRLAPYNCLLVHSQMPTATMVLAASQWLTFNRTVKAGARPLVILRTNGPVGFVFDISDTEGPDLPATIGASNLRQMDAFLAEGEYPDKFMGHLEKTLPKFQIYLCQVEYPPQKAGQIRRMPSSDNFEIQINSAHTPLQRFTTIIHEMGHLCSGHLGQVPWASWVDRSTVSLEVREFEAETISWMVSKRLGIKTGSAAYLHGYSPEAVIPEGVNIDAILVGAGKLEQMGKGTFRPKKVNFLNQNLGYR
jgi:hypothetical protein